MERWHKCIYCQDIYTQQIKPICPKCGQGMPCGVPLDYILELEEIKKENPEELYIIIGQRELARRSRKHHFRK